MTALTYDDIQLVPEYSEIASRQDILLKSKITKYKKLKDYQKRNRDIGREMLSDAYLRKLIYYDYYRSGNPILYKDITKEMIAVKRKIKKDEKQLLKIQNLV